MAPPNDPAKPLDIVLIGGGHAHVFVLRDFGLNPLRRVRLTLIAKELSAPYSGMLPGLVAGHYSYEACHIDLTRLAAFADARLVHGSAETIDRTTRTVLVAAHAPIAYDLLAVDVGITPDIDLMIGAREHTIAVKPVSAFVPKWTDLLQRALTPNGPRKIAAIGGGAAGVELILAVRHRLRAEALRCGLDPEAFSFTLLYGGPLLPSHNRRAQLLAAEALASACVSIVENDPVEHIAVGEMRLTSGRFIAVDDTLISTKAKAPDWFGATDLPLDQGFLALRPTLQLIDDDRIFGAGDCANVIAHRREKSGVFAVRQGPVVAANLRRLAAGTPAKPFTPQSQFLSLVSLGEKSAIAARGPFAAAGRWAWRFKDHIDRSFVEGFNTLCRADRASSSVSF